MGRYLWIACLALSASCAQTSTEQQIVEDAAAAMGGREAVEAVATLSFEAEGERRNLGQDMTPDASSQTFSLTDVRQSMDIQAVRLRVEQTRTPNFLYFRGPDPIPEVYGLDGDVAYNVGSDGAATRASNQTAADRRLELYLHPLTAVRAALEPSAELANARDDGGEKLVDVTAGGRSLTLAIDASTSLPSRVLSLASHPNLRDVTYEASFEDYQDVDGVMLPAEINVTVDGYALTHLALTSQEIDGDVGDLQAPEPARSAAPPSPPPVNVVETELAEGVWLLGGQSHHSVLVELADSAMLIEAPSEARTLAVIAKARELLGDKPLTHLVSTHHHFDHSGGVRAAISEGLTIVTQAANAGFYQKLGEQPSTIIPDALAENPQTATVEAVEDEASYGDDAMTVELYHIADNPHGAALLMAYVPQHRLLIEADAFSPGRDYQPYSPNLLENVRSRGLNVERIVPIHGAVVAFDELVRGAGGMTN